MGNRIIVHAERDEYCPDCIMLRTVSHARKSPFCFEVDKSVLEQDSLDGIIVNDLNSYAKICRSTDTGIMSIDFTWLYKDLDEEGGVYGYTESVAFPYKGLHEFISGNTGCPEFKALSMDINAKRPRIIFKSQRNLHAALSDRVMRHKLSVFLRDGFSWTHADRIEICDSCISSRFAFQEIDGGKPYRYGEIIYNSMDNPDESYYSLYLEGSMDNA